MINILVNKIFQKEFKKIIEIDQTYVLQKMELFRTENPNLDIKKLSPKKYNYYRLRVGKYRLVFQYTAKKEVTFLKVDKRDSIYFKI